MRNGVLVAQLHGKGGESMPLSWPLVLSVETEVEA